MKEFLIECEPLLLLMQIFIPLVQPSNEDREVLTSLQNIFSNKLHGAGNVFYIAHYWYYIKVNC